MFVFALTGGIASGKTLVSSYLQLELGCPVVDADVIARQGKPCSLWACRGFVAISHAPSSLQLWNQGNQLGRL